jgi:hypothetical protein
MNLESDVGEPVEQNGSHAAVQIALHLLHVLRVERVALLFRAQKAINVVDVLGDTLRILVVKLVNVVHPGGNRSLFKCVVSKQLKQLKKQNQTWSTGAAGCGSAGGAEISSDSSRDMLTQPSSPTTSFRSTSSIIVPAARTGNSTTISTSRHSLLLALRTAAAGRETTADVSGFFPKGTTTCAAAFCNCTPKLRCPATAPSF